MSERFVVQGESVIVDRDTGLMWQRVPSQDRMVWKEGFGYVETLNKESFGGYRDWRYPFYRSNAIGFRVVAVE